MDCYEVSPTKRSLLYGKIDIWQEIWVGRSEGAVPGQASGLGGPFTERGASIYQNGRSVYCQPSKKENPKESLTALRIELIEAHTRDTLGATVKSW